MPNASTRFFTSPLVWAGLLAVTAASAHLSAQPLPPNTTALPTSPRAPVASESRGDDVTGIRLREGTQITNQLGRFQQASDTATFVTNDGAVLGGLPNLNLQRIMRTLKTVDDPDSVWWSVSGTITEFSNRNYLLISRAVYKAATPPPAPERIETESPSAE